MDKLERKEREKLKKGYIQKAVLGVIASVGLATMAIVAPNSLQILKPLLKNRKNGYYSSTIKMTVGRLLKNGLVKFENINGKKYLKITEKGEKKLELMEMMDFQLPKPKRWDKKWRILIFDIKENQKTMRELIRRTLSSVGFIWLQDSVWVYPYACEDFVVLFKSYFEIVNDLLYIIADEIENDKKIKNYFGLLDN